MIKMRLFHLAVLTLVIALPLLAACGGRYS